MNLGTMAEVGLLSILADKIQELKKISLKIKKKSKAVSHC